jgi:hypothetical protein
MKLNNDKNNENLKKILCFNMMNNKKCGYGNKCMYAHSLSEQKIEPIRHKLYTLIKAADNLNNIDLINDQKLYDSMLQLTRVCSSCSKGLCPGGYNCRHGAISIKCKICYEDLVYGNCKKQNCQSVHLTQKGLIPFIKQKYPDTKQYTKNNQNITDDKSDDSFKKQKTKAKKDLDNVKGILLTESFLKSYFGKTNLTISSDSDTEDDVDGMIKYLNDDDSDSDASIFLV